MLGEKVVGCTILISMNTYQYDDRFWGDCLVSSKKTRMTYAGTRLSLCYSTGPPALGHQSVTHGERGIQSIKNWKPVLE